MNTPVGLPRPGPRNAWATAHVERLAASHLRLTGRPLHDDATGGTARARAIYTAPYALLSHGLGEDPLFNYGNLRAQALFELDWPRLVRTPSRASAVPAAQEARERFMREVRERGYVEGYSGLRVTAGGRQFVIADVTVWNVVDADGRYHGQAACIRRWHDP